MNSQIVQNVFDVENVSKLVQEGQSIASYQKNYVGNSSVLVTVEVTFALGSYMRSEGSCSRRLYVAGGVKQEP